MDKPTPPLAAEIEMVKQAYASLNRNDVAAFVKDFHPDIERSEHFDFPGGGVYHGIEAVKAHVEHHRGNWAEGSCEPQRFIVAGDKIVVLVQVHVRLKHEAQWRDGRVADGFAFREGKAVQFRTFGSEQQALQWAGIEATDAK